MKTMKISSLYNNVREINNSKIRSLLYKTTKVLVNLLYPFVAMPTENGVDSDANVIISLTTIPSRVDTVWLTISTLLKQTKKPYAVVLWLAEDEFPEGKKGLPSRLLRLEKWGLQIRFCENLKPHKKYYFSMKAYPEYNILTVDDDFFYSEELLEELLACSLANPGCVCCTWAHEIQLNDVGIFLPYNSWRTLKMDSEATLSLLPVGCGGVIYPPHSLHEQAFDMENIKDLCLTVDDLWLKVMCVLNDVKSIRVSKPALLHYSIIKKQKAGLYIENARGGKNDVVIDEISKKYPVFLDKIRQEQYMQK